MIRSSSQELIIKGETGHGAFICPNPVPPTLSVGDFQSVRSSRRRTDTPITRAGHRARATPPLPRTEEGGRREDRRGKRKRRTEERKRARLTRGRENDEEQEKGGRGGRGKKIKERGRDEEDGGEEEGRRRRKGHFRKDY